MGILDDAGAGAIGALLIKIKPDGKDFQKDLEGITGPAGVNVGKAVGTASKIGLGAALAVGGGLLKLGTDLDSAYDQIRTQTGATGDQLAALKGDFESVAQGSTQSLDIVGQAVADLSQKLDITGPHLQSLSDDFLKLARITGEDVTGAIDSMTGVFNQFGIVGEDQGDLLQSFFQIAQATGASVTDLGEGVQKNGALFAQFGLSVSQSAGLLGLLEKNGLAGRDATVGLTKVLKDAEKAGIDSKDAFTFFATSIKNAATDSDAAGIAIDAFGAKAGPKLAGLIRSGTLDASLSFDSLAKSIDLGTDSIDKVATDTADAAETFKTLKNQLAITLGPAANQLFASFGKAATNMAPALLTVVKALAPLLVAVTSLPAPILAAGIGGLALGASFSKIVGPIKAVGGAIGGLTKLLAANPYVILIAATVALGVIIFKNWDKIKVVIGDVLDWLGPKIGAVVGAVQAAWDATWGAIKGTIDTVFGGIQSAIGTTLDAVSTAIGATTGAIQTAWDATWGAISTTVSTVTGAIGAVFQGFLSTVTTIWGGVTTAISGTINFIVDIPNKIGNVFSGIVSIISAPFRAAFNAIAVAWNNTVGKLSFHVPSWVPGLGGEGFDVPDIPQFAKGGILNRGVTGLVGENGPELFTAGNTGRITSTDDLMAALTGAASRQASMIVQGPLLAITGPVTVRSNDDIVNLSREFAREAATQFRAQGLQTSGV